MPKTSSITLGAGAMTITRDPVVQNVADSIPKGVITYVGGTFNQKPITAQEGEWGYRYVTMTVLHIITDDDKHFNIELQEVSNQPTWSTGLLTGLQQAIADINAWNV